MRIGYLYGMRAYPPRGGNHRHAFELVQGFLRCGHQVAVVDDPEMPGAQSFDASNDGHRDFIASIDLLYVRIDGRRNKTWKSLGECMALACGQRPVVWEINAPATEALAFSWLGGRRVRADGTVDEGLFRRAKRYAHALRRLPAIQAEERYRRSISSCVNAAVCVSSSLVPYATRELGISRTLVLPNGGPLLSRSEILERRSRARKDENGHFNVLYSGSAIYPWQGLDVLSEVIRLAHSRSENILFTLAVNQRTPDLPAGPNVRILESLSGEQLLDATCAADACVCLHPDFSWSPYGFHGSPTKLFEYMACMRPVVASKYGQTEEMLRDGVDVLLCSSAPSEILEKLLRLKNQRKLAADIGERAWRRIHDQLNWQVNAEKTINLLETVHQEHHERAAR